MPCASAPTATGRVMSRFGYRRGMQTGARTFHAGQDFAAPRNTPIYAAYDGVVELVGHDGDPGARLRGYGNAVVLRHADLRLWTLYAHLTRSTAVQGTTVRRGDLLGYSGNTTNGKFSRCTEGGCRQSRFRLEMVPHLHFEVRVPTRAGGSPFPGAYGEFNIDPALFFRHLGGTACDVPGLIAAVRAGEGRALAGLGDYEPPTEVSTSTLGRWLWGGVLLLGGVLGAMQGRRH